MQDKQLMIYGGFELSTPNIPTDSIYRVSLLKLFDFLSRIGPSFDYLYLRLPN